jgi:quercetin dioxygenase-like cupin family protein
MPTNIIQVQKWPHEQKPTQEMLDQLMREEGLEPYRWANEPFHVYPAHEHDYRKIIFVISGSIMFGFPIDGAPTIMRAGDRLDLPPHVMHNAAVGEDGVVCLEAHQYS